MDRAQKLVVVATLLVVAITASCSSAQTFCNMPYSGLMSCKPAVTAPNPANPSSSCCGSLSHADLNCLCSYKNSQVLPSLGIDPGLAMQLPSKCKLPTPANC